MNMNTDIFKNLEGSLIRFNDHVVWLPFNKCGIKAHQYTFKSSSDVFFLIEVRKAINTKLFDGLVLQELQDASTSSKLVTFRVFYMGVVCDIKATADQYYVVWSEKCKRS
jgi:hypothetical protein